MHISVFCKLIDKCELEMLPKLSDYSVWCKIAKLLDRIIWNVGFVSIQYLSVNLFDCYPLIGDCLISLESLLYSAFRKDAFVIK